jgi:hypothetical protein
VPSVNKRSIEQSGRLQAPSHQINVLVNYKAVVDLKELLFAVVAVLGLRTLRQHIQTHGILAETINEIEGTNHVAQRL